MRVAIVTVSFLLIGVLAVSLFNKVRGPTQLRAFVAGVATMRIIPSRWASLGAAAAIAAEASVLGLLVWPRTALVGFGAAALLFGAFTAALARAVARGADVGCHCFGASRTPVAPRHEVRSGFLCVAALAGLAGSLALPTAPLADIASPQAMVALTLAAVAVTALVRLDDLIWLFRGGTHPA